MRPAPHNVDDLLNAKLTPQPVTMTQTHQVEDEKPQVSSQSDEGDTEEKLTFTEKFRRDKAEILGDESAENMQKSPEKSDKPEELAAEPEVKEEKSPEISEEADEYGNELPKARTYTEEEVQRMIRDRLSRGRQQPEEAPPPSQRQLEMAKDQGFEVDQNSPDSWEEQLNSFIDKRVDAREKKAQDRQWKEQEQRVQAEFEAKFSTGMHRYKDFANVVDGKPITNSMLMSVRSMKDPAAFIYAAAKQQPKELDRISQITDTYQQAAEMGRLEERMRKAKSVSQAPKPVSKTRGDMGAYKGEQKMTVDQLIALDAKRKLSRR